MKKELTPKEEAFKIYRELQKVWQKQRKLGRHTLKTPREKGWTVEFSVREDILLSSQGEHIKKILPFVRSGCYQKLLVSKQENLKMEGTRAYHYVPSITIPKKWVWEEVVPQCHIDEYQKKNLDWPDYYWTKYFRRSTKYVGPYYNGPERYDYSLINHWYFAASIVPNYIVSIPIIDPELERQEKFLEQKMEQNNYWRFIYGKDSDSYRYEGMMRIYRQTQREFENEIRKENLDNLKN